MKYLNLIILFNLLALSNNLSAQNSKIDSVSYGIGANFSGQVQMIRKRLSMTETKLNEGAYFSGFNSIIDGTKFKFPTDKQQAILLNFSKVEGILVRDKKKSVNLNISKDSSIETLMDSVSYSLGVKFADNAKNTYQALEKDLQFKINTKKLKLGYTQGASNKSTNVKNEKYKKTITAFKDKRISEIYQGNNLEGEKFLTNNKTKQGVKTTESGLQYLVMKEGTGEKPVATSTVKVHYHGTLLDGTVFDSSVERKEPTTLPLNRVIKGWTEGVQLMTLGSKYKFFIPSSLAYGDQIGPKIKPFSTLIFEVELLDIVKTNKP